MADTVIACMVRPGMTVTDGTHRATVLNRPRTSRYRPGHVAFEVRRDDGRGVTVVVPDTERMELA